MRDQRRAGMLDGHRPPGDTGRPLTDGGPRPPPNAHGLQDCGHVGQFAGVCQYDRCGKQLCEACCLSCRTCGKVLCRAHQTVVADQVVCCPVDAKRYVAKRLALRLLGREGTDE